MIHWCHCILIIIGITLSWFSNSGWSVLLKDTSTRAGIEPPTLWLKNVPANHWPTVASSNYSPHVFKPIAALGMLRVSMSRITVIHDGRSNFLLTVKKWIHLVSVSVWNDCFLECCYFQLCFSVNQLQGSNVCTHKSHKHTHTHTHPEGVYLPVTLDSGYTQFSQIEDGT